MLLHLLGLKGHILALGSPVMQGQIWPELGLPLGFLSPTEELLCLQWQGYLCHSGQRVWMMFNKNIESELMAVMGFNIKFVCKLTNIGGKCLQGRESVTLSQAANLL